MINVIIASVLVTWLVIATVTVVTDDEFFASFPLWLLYKMFRFVTFPVRQIVYKPKTAALYERIKTCNFYKRRFGKCFHIVTMYSYDMGDKIVPLYKRILSHVPIIVYFRVIGENIEDTDEDVKEKVREYNEAAELQKKKMQEFEPDEWEKNTF